MEICQNCDRDWVAHNENIFIPDDNGFFSIWTPSCPNALSGVQKYPCPSSVQELGPICAATCDLLAACMVDPQQVSAECRQFAAKLVFQRALESVLYTQPAVEVAVAIMEKERNSPVFTLRLNSCFDLLYIGRENMRPAKYTNVTYFLKQIYTVLESRSVSVEIFNTQLSSFFLDCLLKWCQLCLESPVNYSLTEMETFHHVIKSTTTDMRRKFPVETKRLRCSIANAVAHATLKKGVRLILWAILQLFPVE
ncbi:hypothetical protein LSTR_LSTR004675 [Laodelphax striatellus]|uniref:Uncharacterized protein n=1 Tax=Laodelphax striatellus TaxID=195883 RepID=A0A482WTS5_LAOST|nr:hypothetical protein LSTR_LSTR004675 [Laodelphax striatellus]